MSAVARTKQAVGNVAVQQSQYLTFVLGGETFAIAVVGIKEIVPYINLTAVPMMPNFIRGVINLRGSVVPVVDLAARFGQGTSTMTKRTCIVIIEVGINDEKQDIGMMVDAVSAVLDVASDQIEPAPAFGARIRTDFISGMAKVGGKFVIILNIDYVLSVEEMTLVAGVRRESVSGVS